MLNTAMMINIKRRGIIIFDCCSILRPEHWIIVKMNSIMDVPSERWKLFAFENRWPCTFVKTCFWQGFVILQLRAKSSNLEYVALNGVRLSIETSLPTEFLPQQIMLLLDV